MHRLLAAVSLTSISALGLAASPVMAQVTLTEDLKLLAPDGIAFDRFGRDVAVDETTMVVGAPFDDDFGDGSGAAYRFRTSDGAFLGKLRVTGGNSEDMFGEAVAVQNGVQIVGVPRSTQNTFNAGAAALFAGNTQQDLLLPFSPPPFAPDFSRFGGAVALSADGTTQVVGARGDTGQADAGSNGGGGAIYAFRSGQPALKLFASDADFADNFGFAVATTNSVAVGSAPFDDDNGSASGSIYAYDLADGTERFKFVPADTVADDFFGRAVAISGDTIAAGAPFQSAQDRGGAVYLVDAITGAQLDKLTVPGANALGFAVAVDGPLLVAGGNSEAFVFELPSGALLAELTPSDPQDELFFGASVEISGRTVVVGAEGDETNGERAGAAYVFRLPELADGDADGVIDAQDNCLTEANPAQRDADSDGFGNRCDADFNNDCVVNVQDLGILRTTFFSDDPVTDLDGDGTVNAVDLGRLRIGFFAPPGPSGVALCEN